MAWGEMSRAWMFREGMHGDRRADSRSGMQPVPVQRSRMRKGFGDKGGMEAARRAAR